MRYNAQTDPAVLLGGPTQKEMNMSKNVGTADRIIRATIGLVAIALTITGRWAPWGWIGIVPLVTGLVGYCPVYRMLGLNTCAV